MNNPPHGLQENGQFWRGLVPNQITLQQAPPEFRVKDP